MFFTKSPLKGGSGLVGYQCSDNHFANKMKNKEEMKRGTYEVGIWKSGMARL